MSDVYMKKYPITLPKCQKEVEIELKDIRIHGSRTIQVSIYQYLERNIFKFLGLKKYKVVEYRYNDYEWNFNYKAIAMNAIERLEEAEISALYNIALIENEKRIFRDWDGNL